MADEKVDGPVDEPVIEVVEYEKVDQSSGEVVDVVKVDGVPDAEDQAQFDEINADNADQNPHEYSADPHGTPTNEPQRDTARLDAEAARKAFEGTDEAKVIEDAKNAAQGVQPVEDDEDSQ